MRLWIRDLKGNVVIAYAEKNDDEGCQKCLNEVVLGKCHKKRFANRKIDADKEFVFCHEKNVVSKQASVTSKMVIFGFRKAYQIANSIVTDLTDLETIALHNAKKLTASVGLKIDKIASEEDMSKSVDKISFIEGKLKTSPREAAREILSIKRAVSQIEYEYNALESFRKQGEKGIEIGFTRHKAHTVVLTSFYLLEENFYSNGLRLKIDPYQGYVNIDFGTAKSAISQILSNAIKFCKPSSEIHTRFLEKDGFVLIKFEMISRFFTNDEKKHFTEKKYRGGNSVNTEGQGIGLFAVQRMMSLNAGSLEINSHEGTKFESGGVIYSRNEFTLSFHGN